MKIRVPDPEDSRYWYYDVRDLQERFNEQKYLEDFQKWKKELKRLLTNYASPCKLYPECYNDCRICIREILGLDIH